MKQYLMTAASLLALVVAQPAHADFVYTLTSTSVTGIGSTPPTHLDMQLTLTDAALASGSFTASRNCSQGSCGINTGNFNEITLTLTSPFAAILINNSPSLIFDDINVSLTFGPGGSITSGNISENDIHAFIELNPLTISGDTWNANFNSDLFSGRCPPSDCTATGTLSFAEAVPEPASLTLLGTGLLGLGLLRRSRSAG